tara:strand:+ start:1324 stop:1479 length:156 start_codon:yes stop_codon:yes gene_type:complete
MAKFKLDKTKKVEVSNEKAIKDDYKSGIKNLRLLANKYNITINEVLKNINK